MSSYNSDDDRELSNSEKVLKLQMIAENRRNQMKIRLAEDRRRNQQLAELQQIAVDSRNQMKKRLADDRRNQQLQQLAEIAMNSRNQMKKRLAEDRRNQQLPEHQPLDELIRIAKARQEKMSSRNRRRNSFRRRKSFEEYNANVPFLGRSNSRGNSDERIIYNEPLEVINVSPRNETDFQRILRLTVERDRNNPTAPKLQKKCPYVPRSSYGPNFAVRDNDAIKKHTQAKRDSAARIITKMMKNKTRKQGNVNKLK
jgi:hypothetical protein